MINEDESSPRAKLGSEDVQDSLWRIKSELLGLSGLFSNMGSCNLSEEETSGVGFLLTDLSDRLSAIYDRFLKIPSVGSGK